MDSPRSPPANIQARGSPPSITRRRRVRQENQSPQSVLELHSRLANMIRFFLGIVQRTTRVGNIISPFTGNTVLITQPGFLDMFNDIKFAYMSTTEPVEVTERVYLLNLIRIAEAEVSYELGNRDGISWPFSPYARNNASQEALGVSPGNFHYASTVSYAQRLMMMLHEGTFQELDNERAPSRSRSRSMSRSVSSPLLSASPSARHVVLSASLDDTEELNMVDLCRSKFEELGKNNEVFQQHAPLRAMIHKMKRLCNQLIHSQHCDATSLAKIVQKARKKYTMHHGARFGMRNVKHNKEFVEMFQTFEDNLNELRTPFENWNITYLNEPAIDVGGVRTNFCQAAASQLLGSGLFVETEEGSGRYMFNPSPTVQNIHGEDKYNVCKFVGALLAFFMMNNFPIDFHLSRTISMRLLYKDNEIDGDDFATIFLLECPQEGRSFLKLLSNPHDIPHASLDFADIDPSQPSEEVTPSNFRKYIGLHAMTRLLPIETERMFQHFKSGFFITHRFLRSQNMTVPQLDTILTSIEVTEEQKEAIVATMMNSIAHDMQAWQSRSSIEDNKKLRCCLWFKSIVKDGNRGFPTDEVTNVPHLPQNYKQFLQMLLFFWTGKKSYDPSFQYKFVVYGGQNFAAHTCSHQMDIPYMFRSRNEMYRQLVRSISSSDFGFG